MAAPSWLARANDFFWHELPASTAQRSATWASLGADGDHLAAWPILGAGLPALAGLLGFAIGVGHFGYAPSDQIVFLFSLPALLAFVVLGMQGAGVGLWMWLGFAVGDLAWAVLSLPSTIRPEMMLAGRLLQDLLLAGGLIGLPAAVAGLSQRLAVRSDPELPLEGLLRAGLGFTLVWLWLMATAVQLQAVYTFAGIGAHTHGLVASFASDGWAIALAGACAASARGLAQKAALRVPGHAARMAALRKLITDRRNADLPRSAAAVVAKAALSTFALSTFIGAWEEGLIAFGAIAVILAMRDFGLGRLGLGAQIAGMASLPIRLASAVVLVCVAAGFVLGRGAAQNSFTPTLEAVLVALLVYALLLPEGAARAQAGADGKGRKAA
jgi:hypothetical protein